MKVAVQLSGYFNNRADPLSGMAGHHYIQEEIVAPVEKLGGKVDFFIHSWDVAREQQIRKLYNPAAAVFEPQKNFQNEIDTLGLADHDYYDKGFNRAVTKFAQCKLTSTLSFLYGRHEANTIRVRHSKEYDCVVMTRFDLGQRDKTGKKRKYSVSEITFSPQADMNYLYCSMWDQLNAGLADQWFYGGPKIINRLSSAYLCAINRDFRKGSDYEKAVTEGWPDSQPIDNMSGTDPRQFSNEALRPGSEKSKELMKYPLWQCINNHIYYKWVAMDRKLYHKIKYV